MRVLRIMEKYSFSEKNASTMSEISETMGLNRVARQKMASMPHQVLIFVPMPE
ncbi:hypothetical protein D3C74_476920 [compost metagenome]